MDRLTLDKDGIYEYQQNRPPYLMIDYAEEVVPGVSARGYKDLTPEEWFFACHWPGDPTMPGMLQVEALMQMCALAILTQPEHKGKIVYVTAANKVKFSRKVVEGDRFQIETQLKTWKRGVGICVGEGSVNGELACQAEFTMILPDVLQSMKVGSKS